MAALDLSKKKRIALVCSGGAVKASAFHVGVALALEQQGFRFQGGLRDEVRVDDQESEKRIQVYVGSSAGSLISAYLASGKSLEWLISNFRQEESNSSIPGLKYWQMLAPRKKVWLPWLSAKPQSVFSTEGISQFVKEKILSTDRFSQLKADLFVVSTELNRSKKVVFGKYKSVPVNPYIEYRNDVAISDALAASMALPPVYHPYTLTIEGKKREFFDGEIREPLSSHVALEAGADLIICSYTHQPLRVPEGNPGLSEKNVQTITLQAINQAIEQKIWSSRGNRMKEKALVDYVRRFFRDKNLPNELLDEMVQGLEERMTYKHNVDYIHIHPRPNDERMFFAPHFSLNKKVTEEIVRTGYSAAMSALRGLDEFSA